MPPESFYVRPAQYFSCWIAEMFASEDSLRAVYERHYPALPFDRTERWNRILAKEMKRCWSEAGPEGVTLNFFDAAQVLRQLHGMLDFNLWTQVYLNVHTLDACIRYRKVDAEAALKELRPAWEGKSPTPFDTKPRMFKSAKTPDELLYNRHLSTIKALAIISGVIGVASFRVSPKGMTPALADNQNLSMLGVGGDRMLEVPAGYKAYYFTWEQAPDRLEFAGGVYRHPKIGYPFTSKSGGEILAASLFTREVMHTIYGLQEEESLFGLLPRLNSVLLVSSTKPESIASVHRALLTLHPGIELHVGAREEQPQAAQPVL